MLFSGLLSLSPMMSKYYDLVCRAVTILLVFFCLFAQTPMCLAQEADSNEPAEKQSYVKIEIGYMGLHCPFLGTSLKDKLKEEERFSNLFIDKADTYLTFSFDKSLNITESDLIKIPKDVGFSEEIISITISDIPFSTDQ